MIRAVGPSAELELRAFEFFERRDAALPLPEGEGRGEGEERVQCGTRFELKNVRKVRGPLALWFSA